MSDTGALGAIVDEVIAEHPDVVEQFRAGKEGVIGFLVGQVMKASGGSANPKLAQELLRERLWPDSRGDAVRVSNKPPRVPLVATGRSSASRAPRSRSCGRSARMWRSEQPLDRYGLCHFTSVAGDALLAISLADSVFFSLPVGQAKTAGRALPAAHDGAARARRARC